MDVVHCSNRVKAAAKVSAEYHHVVDKVKEDRGRMVQESKKAPIIPVTAHMGQLPSRGEKPQPVRDGELPPISISTEVQQFNEEKQNSLVETMLDDLPVAKKARSSHSDESSGGTHFSQALMVQQEVYHINQQQIQKFATQIKKTDLKKLQKVKTLLEELGI